MALTAGDFEAFPLPEDAANFVTDGYTSYFVEVEPGIKVHVLEVGSGFPLVLCTATPPRDSSTARWRRRCRRNGSA